MSGSIHEWLESRTPAPPPALRARVEQALLAVAGTECGDASVAGASEARERVDPAVESVTPERCIAAAMAMLQPLLVREHAGREAALDLLAADALVTYAFEAASAQPEMLDERANMAMRAIASLASPASFASPASPAASIPRPISRG